MENNYTTSDIAALFGVSVQSVKNWAREFSDYLTPTATPAAGQKRNFKEDDLRVFALVREYTVRGNTFSDAHMALRAGQRGEIPTSALTTPEPQLLTKLRDQIDQLNQRLIEEKASGDEARGQVRLLKEILAEKEQQIKSLYIELGNKK